MVPHLWKTGISIAAAAHMAAATPHCAFIECLPAALCESALRKELVADDIRVENGIIPLPAGPGLGIELNRSALERFEAAAANAARVPLTRARGSERPLTCR